jgi:hypothetical protein
LAQSSALALAASLALTADLDFTEEDWAFTPPIELAPGAGAVTFSADLSYATTPVGVGRYFGKRYWGRDYFGPYYWGTSDTWGLEVTLGPELTGAGTLSADPTLALAIDPTTLAAIGTATLAADLVLVTGFPVAQTNTLAAAGAVTLAGDLRIDVDEPLAVSTGLEMQGAVTLAADIAASAEKILDPSTLAALGTVSFRLPYGDFIFYRPSPPATDYPEDGAAIPTRPRWRRTYAKGWLAAFVNSAPEDTPGASSEVQ